MRITVSAKKAASKFMCLMLAVIMTITPTVAPIQSAHANPPAAPKLPSKALNEFQKAAMIALTELGVERHNISYPLPGREGQIQATGQAVYKIPAHAPLWVVQRLVGVVEGVLTPQEHELLIYTETALHDAQNVVSQSGLTDEELYRRDKILNKLDDNVPVQGKNTVEPTMADLTQIDGAVIPGLSNDVILQDLEPLKETDPDLFSVLEDNAAADGANTVPERNRLQFIKKYASRLMVYYAGIHASLLGAGQISASMGLGTIADVALNGGAVTVGALLVHLGYKYLNMTHLREEQQRFGIFAAMSKGAKKPKVEVTSLDLYKSGVINDGDLQVIRNTILMSSGRELSDAVVQSSAVYQKLITHYQSLSDPLAEQKAQADYLMIYELEQQWSKFRSYKDGQGVEMRNADYYMILVRFWGQGIGNTLTFYLLLSTPLVVALPSGMFIGVLSAIFMAMNLPFIIPMINHPGAFDYERFGVSSSDFVNYMKKFSPLRVMNNLYRAIIKTGRSAALLANPMLENNSIFTRKMNQVEYFFTQLDQIDHNDSRLSKEEMIDLYDYKMMRQLQKSGHVRHGSIVDRSLVAIYDATKIDRHRSEKFWNFQFKYAMLEVFGFVMIYQGFRLGVETALGFPASYSLEEFVHTTVEAGFFASVAQGGLDYLAGKYKLWRERAIKALKIEAEANNRGQTNDIIESEYETRMEETEIKTNAISMMASMICVMLGAVAANEGAAIEAGLIEPGLITYGLVLKLVGIPGLVGAARLNVGSFAGILEHVARALPKGMIGIQELVGKMNRLTLEFQHPQGRSVGEIWKQFNREEAIRREAIRDLAPPPAIEPPPLRAKRGFFRFFEGIGQGMRRAVDLGDDFKQGLNEARAYLERAEQYDTGQNNGANVIQPDLFDNNETEAFGTRACHAHFN